MNYQLYLRSDAWKLTKERYWKSKLPKRCHICLTSNNLQLHHKSYNRLGNEKLINLVPLCSECHYKLHFSHPTLGKTPLNWKAMNKRMKRLGKAHTNKNHHPKRT